ncbi:hypothetical protein PTW37_10145 [Arthrobacter agilis]|uniref:hypothetical protein n=1 Tax=Arthrobacter agilis TaxID=37921 RepID=UPI00236512F2|nr:hypothetical protein [Arthrobacter agilis]WDF32235.1 hypothetical protein PTW37_10145 [Arthrobacter agilis]
MGGQQITMHVEELIEQAKHVRNSIDTMNYWYEKKPRGNASPTIAAAQAALSHSVAITRLIWPNPPSRDRDGNKLTGEPLDRHRWIIDRGKMMRRIVGPVDEQTWILGNRRLRNAYEHFDEYLDNFLFDIDRGKRPNVIVDTGVLPRGAIRIDGEIPTYLRLLDPELWELSLIDEKVSLPQLVKEVLTVDERAREWLRLERLKPPE